MLFQRNPYVVGSNPTRPAILEKYSNVCTDSLLILYQKYNHVDHQTLHLWEFFSYIHHVCLFYKTNKFLQNHFENLFPLLSLKLKYSYISWSRRVFMSIFMIFDKFFMCY